jgi:hypothetical protein
LELGAEQGENECPREGEESFFGKMFSVTYEAMKLLYMFTRQENLRPTPTPITVY